MRELYLDGGEITLLKRIGLSGAQMYGKLLVDTVEDEDMPVFLNTLNGLIEQDYVLSSKTNLRTSDDVKSAFLRVNPSFAVALRDAVSPARKRAREMDRERQQRRRRRR